LTPTATVTDISFSWHSAKLCSSMVAFSRLNYCGSVITRCYWCILLDHPIAASAHGSAPQQLSLLNVTNLAEKQVLCSTNFRYSNVSMQARMVLCLQKDI